MRFDPNDKKFFFNEEMTLTPAGDENLRARIREYRSEVIDHPGRFLQSKKQNNSQFEIIRNIAAGVILALSVFGLIWTVPDKRYDISGWIVTGLAVMFALILLIFPEKGASKYFTESVLSQRIQGVILMIGAALCGYVQLSMSSEGTRSVKMRWFILCIAVGVAMIIKAIGYLNASKSIYREEADAVCIGYCRTFEYDNEMPVILSSPVFEYYYDGQKYQACYDVFDRIRDGRIPVGSSCKINIDPDAPERVKGNHNALLPTIVISAVLCFIGAVVLRLFLR